MENLEKIKSPASESVEYFLKPGLQTESTERIKEIGHTIEGSFVEKVLTILDIVSKLPLRQENKESIFRRRTADQILSDGFVTGCTDIALVFIALLRTVGIPSKYVETIDEDWLQNGGDNITGHVYVNAFDGSRWRIIDPMKKVIDANPDQDGRVNYKEGLDSWDIGIDSFDMLIKQFNDFRNQTLIK